MPSRSMQRMAGLALASALCAAPYAANANGVIVLPGAQWTGFVSTPVGFPSHDFVTQQVTGPGLTQNGSSGNLSAGVGGAPAPLPYISARAGGNDLAQFNGSRAHIALTYYIEITGPGSGSAPLVISGAGGLTTLYDGVAFARLDVGDGTARSSTSVGIDNGVVSIGDSDGLHLVVPDASAFTIHNTVLFPINKAIQVIMIATADSAFKLGPSDATAFIDPVFSIDPSFANADQYSIVTSDGIGNGAGAGGVPEPAAWGMMLLGFAGLGVMARRRRSRRAPAAA